MDTTVYWPKTMPSKNSPQKYLKENNFVILKALRWWQLRALLPVRPNACAGLGYFHVCARPSDFDPDLSSWFHHSLRNQQGWPRLLLHPSKRLQCKSLQNTANASKICSCTVHLYGCLGVLKSVDFQGQSELSERWYHLHASRSQRWIVRHAVYAWISVLICASVPHFGFPCAALLSTLQNRIMLLNRQ